MSDLPRPALQLVEGMPPAQPGAPKQDGPATQPSARSERASGEHEGWAIYERFPELGELIAGRGPHG